MATSDTRGFGAVSKIGRLLEAVKFEHTLFALPFAYLGMILAAGGLPAWQQVLWITLAMVGARTVAMGANRLIDRHIDALNPRTARRALPLGLITPREMLALCAISFAVLMFSAWQLNPLCFVLAPVATFIIVGYSYTKRFTWLCHLVLGLADGLAPIGGWFAITGNFSAPPFVLGLSVALWIGGFDLIFACQDVGFDLKNKLQSVPARFGIQTALLASSITHVVAVALLILLGILQGLAPLYYVGIALASIILVYEHRVVTPTDLSRLNFAFFNLNACVAVVLFIFTFAAIVIRGP